MALQIDGWHVFNSPTVLGRDMQVGLGSVVLFFVTSLFQSKSHCAHTPHSLPLFAAPAAATGPVFFLLLVCFSLSHIARTLRTHCRYSPHPPPLPAPYFILLLVCFSPSDIARTRVILLLVCFSPSHHVFQSSIRVNASQVITSLSWSFSYSCWSNDTCISKSYCIWVKGILSYTYDKRRCYWYVMSYVTKCVISTQLVTYDEMRKNHDYHVWHHNIGLWCQNISGQQGV